MKKLTKTNLFKAQLPKPEKAMDKTTRLAKKMIDEEAERRLRKTDRLRNARLEMEARAPED